MRSVAHFGCFALALGMMLIGGPAQAEQSRPQSNHTVEVRVLPNGKYLYKGKEITARELMRLGEHEDIDLVMSKDQLLKSPLYKQIQEDAKRNGGVTHFGFTGVPAQKIDSGR